MRLIDFEKARKEVLAVLAGKVNTVIAIKVVEALKKATIEAPAQPISFWEQYSTSAYGGYKNGEVRWLPRKFYRCEKCRKGSAIRSNYCPNCGAKMLKEGDPDAG